MIVKLIYVLYTKRESDPKLWIPVYDLFFHAVLIFYCLFFSMKGPENVIKFWAEFSFSIKNFSASQESHTLRAQWFLLNQDDSEMGVIAQRMLAFLDIYTLTVVKMDHHQQAISVAPLVRVWLMRWFEKSYTICMNVILLCQCKNSLRVLYLSPVKL